MTFFEKTLRQMFGESEVLPDPEFSDKTLLAKLDEDFRVKVSFTTLGVADHYEALRVRIINRTEGEVDSQVFKLDTVLDGKHTDHPYLSGVQICDYGLGFEWYGYHPSANDLKQIAQTMADYVSMYQSQGMEMSGLSESGSRTSSRWAAIKFCRSRIATSVWRSSGTNSLWPGTAILRKYSSFFLIVTLTGASRTFPPLPLTVRMPVLTAFLAVAVSIRIHSWIRRPA